MRIVNIFELEDNFKFYRCWSPKQKDFLVSNGIDYIYSYRNNSNGKIAWVFVECEKLSVLLREWSNNKPIGGGNNGQASY